jgi:hypothetical protein
MFLRRYAKLMLICGSLQACTFPASETTTDADANTGDGANPVDASATEFAVAHLQPVKLAELTAKVEINAAVTIDTSVAGSTTTTGGAFVIKFVLQTNNDVAAVAYFDSLIIRAPVTVRGSKPLIIVARGIEIDGGAGIFAGADKATSGPGGSKAAGIGSGGKGSIADGYAPDSAGGGAGFGAAGAPGGTFDAAKIPAGGGGNIYGENPLIKLQGGSAGGASVQCVDAAPGGAGGGGLQLSVLNELKVFGSIDAGGGGGSGGALCPNGALFTHYSAGSGGGSGGMIYLEAGSLLVSGTVTANGGGGGSGAVFDNPPGLNNIVSIAGNPGDNGRRSRTAASGGTAPAGSDYLSTGGDGGYFGITAETGDPQAGANYRNGGGGGGAVGRIVLRSAVPLNLTGIFSPAPSL